MQATDWKPLDLYGAYRRGYITDERYAAITDEGSTTVKERRKVVNVPTAERHPIWRAAVEDGKDDKEGGGEPPRSPSSRSPTPTHYNLNSLTRSLISGGVQ